MKYDLHSHTTMSDGKLTPVELLQRAVQMQVDVLAITDHDTVNAIAPARAYLVEQQLPLQLIGGVEISTRWENFEIHIVGLNVDETNPLLIERLHSQIQYRNERAREIGLRLERAGIPDAYINAKRIAGDAAISRSHYAKYLIEIGKAKSFTDVFKKYMKRGKTGYVSSQWQSIETAIQWIHDAGGVAVIAHPSRYGLSGKWLRRLIVQFKAANGDALEVALPQQSTTERSDLGAYCLEYDLLASVGSDFHSPNRWSELGKNLYLSDKYQPVWHNWQNLQR
ncbi:MAG: putative metal-dependent phosphoesterase TrpH [Alteromonadaceae bacterium]